MNDKRLEIILAAKDASAATFKKFQGRLKSVTDSVFSMQGVMVAAAGAAGVAALVKSSLNAADAIGKTADAAGITTKTLQELRHAADLSGVSTSTLDKSMEAFGKRLGEVRVGTGALYTYLNKSNKALLEQVQAAGSSDEALDLLMKSLAGTTNQADKAALAAAAFGRSGIRMSLMTKDGAKGLADMRQEAEDLGLVMDEKLIRASEQANDAISKVTGSIKTGFQTALVSVAPQITAVAESMSDWIKANREELQKLIKVKFVSWLDTGKAAIKAITPILMTIRTELGYMWEGFQTLPAWAKEVGIVGALVGGIKGKVILGGMLHLTTAFKNTYDGFNEALKGNIKWSELATMNAQELAEKLAELDKEVSSAGDAWAAINDEINKNTEKTKGNAKEVENAAAAWDVAAEEIIDSWGKMEKVAEGFAEDFDFSFTGMLKGTAKAHHEATEKMITDAGKVAAAWDDSSTGIVDSWGTVEKSAEGFAEDFDLSLTGMLKAADETIGPEGEIKKTAEEGFGRIGDLAESELTAVFQGEFDSIGGFFKDMLGNMYSMFTNWASKLMAKQIVIPMAMSALGPVASAFGASSAVGSAGGGFLGGVASSIGGSPLISGATSIAGSIFGGTQVGLASLLGNSSIAAISDLGMAIVGMNPLLFAGGLALGGFGLTKLLGGIFGHKKKPKEQLRGAASLGFDEYGNFSSSAGFENQGAVGDWYQGSYYMGYGKHTPSDLDQQMLAASADIDASIGTVLTGFSDWVNDFMAGMPGAMAKDFSTALADIDFDWEYANQTGFGEGDVEKSIQAMLDNLNQSIWDAYGGVLSEYVSKGFATGFAEIGVDIAEPLIDASGSMEEFQSQTQTVAMRLGILNQVAESLEPPLTAYAAGLKTLNTNFDSYLAALKAGEATTAEITALEEYRAEALEQYNAAMQDNIDLTLDAADKLVHPMSQFIGQWNRINDQFDGWINNLEQFDATKADIDDMERLRGEALVDFWVSIGEQIESSYAQLINSLASETSSYFGTFQEIDSLIAEAGGVDYRGVDAQWEADTYKLLYENAVANGSASAFDLGIQYGNSLTALAQYAPDYDPRVDLEAIRNDFIKLESPADFYTTVQDSITGFVAGIQTGLDDLVVAIKNLHPQLDMDNIKVDVQVVHDVPSGTTMVTVAGSDGEVGDIKAA